MPPRTLSDDIEDDLKSMAHDLAQEVVDVWDAHGERPPFSPEWPPPLQAALYLPGAYIYGNAEPPVCDRYADGLLDGIDPVTGVTDPHGGPKDTIRFFRLMRSLWDNPETQKAAMIATPPELWQEYGMLLDSDLHRGQWKPNLEDWLKEHKERSRPAAPSGQIDDATLLRYAAQQMAAAPPPVPPTSMAPAFPTMPVAGPLPVTPVAGAAMPPPVAAVPGAQPPGGVPPELLELLMRGGRR